jgi:hypothetical protein
MCKVCQQIHDDRLRRHSPHPLNALAKAEYQRRQLKAAIDASNWRAAQEIAALLNLSRGLGKPCCSDQD